MGGRYFFKMSDECLKEKEFFIKGEDFEAIYNNGVDIEQNSLLLHYVIDNPPFAFREQPLLYDQMRQFIATRIGVLPNDIKLIGSAKTGFSISIEEFGRSYNSNSDFDFAIVDRGLFSKLSKEYNHWRYAFENGNVIPRSDRERGYWNSNVFVVEKNIERKFIDVDKLPALKDVCPIAQNILNTMWQVKDNLKKYNGINIRKASARIYSDFSSFYGQTLLNISFVMKSRRGEYNCVKN